MLAPLAGSGQLTVSISVWPSSTKVRVRSVFTLVQLTPSLPSVWPVCSPTAHWVENRRTVMESSVVVGHSSTL